MPRQNLNNLELIGQYFQYCIPKFHPGCRRRNHAITPPPQHLLDRVPELRILLTAREEVAPTPRFPRSPSTGSTRRHRTQTRFGRPPSLSPTPGPSLAGPSSIPFPPLVAQRLPRLDLGVAIQSSLLDYNYLPAPVTTAAEVEEVTQDADEIITAHSVNDLNNTTVAPASPPADTSITEHYSREAALAQTVKNWTLHIQTTRT
ncbi:hypothetical protein B0H10DRAFT_1958532 [Mycena sp. CBHHK59/15]|nr:hypothetical protein B0H10DRAFT_1958532 [Mycena sp. CBHHK59/15]